MTSNNHSGLPGALFNVQRQSLGRAVAIGLIYFLAVRFSLLFPDSEKVMAAVWPPSGVALGALLLSRKRNWFLVLTAIGVANFVGNISFGKSIPVSLGYVVSNLAEAMLAAWFIARWSGQEVVRFARVGEVLALIGAAVIANGCTTLLGAVTASLGAGAAFWTSYANWWVADGMGMLIVTPLIITWATGGFEMLRTLSPKRLAELAAFFVAWGVVVWLLFGPDDHNRMTPLRPYMILPLLGWAALRFRPCIVATASALLVIISVSYGDTSLGARILSGDDPANRLAMMQIYTALLAIPALLLSVSMIERKQAEEATLQAHKRLLAVFNGLDAIVYVADMETYELLFVNMYVKDAFGDVEGQPCWKAIQTGQTGPCAFCTNHRLLDATGNPGEIYHWEFQNTANGKWYDIHDRALRWVDGRIVRLEIATDISERKKAEEALQESAQRHRTILHTAMDGFWLTDAQGRLLEVNEAYCKMSGHTEQELLAMRIQDLEATEVAAQTAVHMQKIVAQGEDRFESRHRRKDGSVFDIEVSVQYRPVQGGQFVTFVQDISARKQQDEAIRRLNSELEQRIQERTRELQMANRELESFSYSVSHDLRAPLRAIEGFSSLLEMEYSEKLDERAKDYFKRVRGGATRMALLIDDLLNLSRISRQEMHRGPVNLTALAREAAEVLQAAEPEHRVEWLIAPDVRAEGDSGLLRIALQNLIGNAWKYSSKREVARIEFGVTRWNGQQAYFVRDNGEGFDMAYADKLFGAFQRLHSAEEFPGSGIGLATVARIIRRHGGSVGAEGRVHEGATLFFTL